MKTKKILLISKISLLFLTFFFCSVAFASEITGNLNSAGVASGTIVSGGGSIVNGGGQNPNVFGTVNGVVTNGLGNNDLPSPLNGDITSGDLGIITSNIALNSATGGIAPTTNEDISQTATKNIIPSPINAQKYSYQTGLSANQLLAASIYGSVLGSWAWWIFILFLILAYYEYKHYELNRNNDEKEISKKIK